MVSPNGLEPVSQIGRQGLSEESVEGVRTALDDHERVKISMHEPKDEKARATDLAQHTESELYGLIGHTVILYRAHPEKPVIRRPQRAAAEAEAPTDRASVPCRS